MRDKLRRFLLNTIVKFVAITQFFKHELEIYICNNSNNLTTVYYEGRKSNI